MNEIVWFILAFCGAVVVGLIIHTLLTKKPATNTNDQTTPLSSSSKTQQTTTSSSSSSKTQPPKIFSKSIGTHNMKN